MAKGKVIARVCGHLVMAISIMALAASVLMAAPAG